jgi:hypothetical protein
MTPGCLDQGKRSESPCILDQTAYPSKDTKPGGILAQRRSQAGFLGPLSYAPGDTRVPGGRQAGTREQCRLSIVESPRLNLGQPYLLMGN